MQQRRNGGRGAGGRPQVVWLAGALACALASPAFAQQKKPTVEELLHRLEVLEQRAK